MQCDMFDINGNPDEEKPLNTSLKNLMIKEIAEEIFTRKDYRDYLLTTPSTYRKTLDFLESAISFFEKEEDFEFCTKLLIFKNEITEKLN